MQLKVMSERMGSTAGHHRDFYTRQKHTEYTLNYKWILKISSSLSSLGNGD